MEFQNFEVSENDALKNKGVFPAINEFTWSELWELVNPLNGAGKQNHLSRQTRLPKGAKDNAEKVRKSVMP
jgi:hypothetical protein